MIKEDKKYKYKFSVVIPIYKVEKYLEETIESVINQDIGFEENIQIILVNDGSPDNSEEICMKYKNMYPNNVVYVKQKNAGVSVARNNGTKYVEGKYINYLDSDDKWELNIFSKAYIMFENNKGIDVIGVRQKYFEAWDSYPSLDYKFYKDRIVDIHEEYDCIQLSVTSAFIRTTAMEGKEYDTRIKFSEDAKLLYEIILEKEKYGIISSSLHLYRKRYENNSAIQTAQKNISWYLDTTKLSYMYVCDLSMKKYGKVIPFVQYYIMYDIQWRLMPSISENLNEQQREEYIHIIKKLLQKVDDEIIIMQRSLWRERKVYALCLKYGKDIRKDFRYDKGNIYFNNLLINNIKNDKFLEIYIMDVKKDTLILEGRIKDFYPEEDYEIYAKDDKGNKYNLEYYDIPMDNQYSFTEDCIFRGIGFKVNVPLKGIKEIRIMIKYKKYHNKRLTLTFKPLSQLTEKIWEKYIIKNKYIITTKSNKIFIRKHTKKLHIQLEKKFLKYLKTKKEYNMILYRIIYYISKKISKKPIWIISDRTNIANDNGMYLFKYLTKNEKNVKVYFAIDKKSHYYKKIKKIGKVLSYNSFKYKLKFLLSSKIISSQADEWVINAFGDKSIFLRDLYKFKFIFLQHGITINDLSNWLHKFNKNIAMFITSSKSEYDSIINGNYGYTANEVKLTGFPRYDSLENKLKKQIVFMPTWRASLAGKTNKYTGEHEYNPEFKNSEYCKFYNKLINDDRLLGCLKKYGYIAKFCIHPTLKEQINDFYGNEFVQISKRTNYQKEFKENALLITDYSSVVFDFAYLNKPVIYTQFDADTFYEGQVYDKGYFDYEEDGFGPVCYNYKTAVQEIINAVENDCKLEKKYEKRIKNFYAYRDKNNCKRVHQEILRLK